MPRDFNVPRLGAGDFVIAGDDEMGAPPIPNVFDNHYSGGGYHPGGHGGPLAPPGGGGGYPRPPGPMQAPQAPQGGLMPQGATGSAQEQYFANLVQQQQRQALGIPNVQRVGVHKTVTGTLNFVQLAVGAGATVQVVVTPQCPIFKPTRIVCDAATGAKFNLLNVTFGTIPYNVGGGAESLLNYAPNATQMVSHEFPDVANGTNITVQVTNISGGAADFYMSIHGEQAV